MRLTRKASAVVAASLVVLQAAAVQAVGLPTLPKAKTPNFAPNEQVAAAIAKARAEKTAAAASVTPAKKADGVASKKLANLAATHKPDDQVRVIVELSGKSVTQRLSAANATFKSADADTVASWAAEARAERESVIAATMGQGIGLQVRHTYESALNGFSADVAYGQIDEIRKVPGVQRVTLANVYHPDDTSSTAAVGAPTLWEREPSVDGEGTVIAIIDSGIDYRHSELGAQSALDPNGKVIGGHNWADNDSQVLDYGAAGSHGTHVSGIAAGTGEGSLGIPGVAPKAKLIAEKVFGNDNATPSAYTDDLVAAIDDAVNPNSPYHPGVAANVLNMSLGAVSGFSDPLDPEQIAIHNAVEAGAVVSISSGNSSYSTSAIYNPYYRNQDIQAAGSPGTSLDAITVASSLNPSVTISGREVLAVIDGEPYPGSNTKVYVNSSGPYGAFETFGGASFPLAIPTGSALGCTPGDFTDDLTGKIALIKRGTCTFAEKIASAASAGAAGVIVVTQNADPDLITMAADEAPVPAVMVMKSFGNELFAAVEGGQTVTVSFNGNMVNKVMADPAGNTMASSSSWGTTPDLKLKPDVTAPGQNIYSSVMNNQYATFSGTSMAAPHVSGASALIMQAHPDYTPAQVKAALMNTAKVLAPVGSPYPYSPRQQGAGLIQVDKAVDTQVLMTGANGYPSLSLGEIATKGKANFAITLTNSGDTPAKFTLSGNVYRPSTVSTWFNGLSSTPFTGAKVTFYSGNTVTVPAKGTAKVTGVVDLSGITSIPVAADFGLFAEGFIKLTSDNPAVQPDLGMPFMGYMGKWSGPSAPPIVDTMNDDEWCFDCVSGLYVPSDRPGSYDPMGWTWDEDFDPNTFAINNNPNDQFGDPNGYNLYNKTAWPLITFMRNAKQMVIEIVDSNGKVVDKIGSNENLRNIAALEYYLGDWSWDGTRYNPVTGERNPVAEGKYTVRIRTLADGASPAAANWQTNNWPLWVDNTAPTIQLDPASTVPGSVSVLPGEYTLTVTNTTDTGSGLYALYAILDDDIVEIDSAPTGTFTFDVQAGRHDNLMVCAQDNAGNVGCAGQQGAFDTSDFAVLGPTSFATNNAWIELKHAAASSVKEITYQVGDAAPVSNGTNPNIKLNLGEKDGNFDIAVNAYGDAQALITSVIYHVTLDMTPPVVSVTSPEGARPILNTRSVQVGGFVTEAHELRGGVQYSLDGRTWTTLETDLLGNFSFMANFNTDGRKNLTFHGYDAVGNKVEMSRVFTVDTAGPTVNTVFDPATGTAPANINVQVTTPGNFLLTGTAQDAASDYTFSINGSPEYTTETNTPEKPRAWTYDAGEVGGADQVVLALDATDRAGNSSDHRTLTFTKAGSAPIVQISSVGNVTTTNMKVTGKISSKVTSLTVNGTTVKPSGTSFTATVPVSGQAVVIARTSDPTVAGLAMSAVTGALVADSLTLSPADAWSPNGGTLSIKFNMASAGGVVVDVYDANNAKVKSISKSAVKGSNTVTWDGKDTAAHMVDDGVYTMKVTDGIKTLEQSIAISTAAPEAPTLNAVTSPTKTKTVVITGTALGASKVNITVSGPSALTAQNGIAVEADGIFASNTFTMVKNGTYTFSVVAVDALGNKSEAAKTTVVFDTTAPAAPTVTAPSVTNAADTIDLTVTAKELGIVTITPPSGKGEAFTAEVTGTTAFTVPLDISALTEDGSYAYTVTNTDKAGNTSSAKTVTFKVDRTAPTFTFTKGVTADLTGSGTAGATYTIQFKVNDANWTTANKPVVTFNGAAVTPTYSTTTKVYTVTGKLVANDNTFVFNVVDAAGNAAETVTVTVTGN